MQIDPDGSGPRTPVDNMREVEPEVLAGTLDPGNFRIVREIQRPAATGGDVDTAVFSGPRADYAVDNAGTIVTVEHVGGTLVDGRDRLTRSSA